MTPTPPPPVETLSAAPKAAPLANKDYILHTIQQNPTSPKILDLASKWTAEKGAVTTGIRAGLNVLLPFVAPAATIFLVAYGVKTMVKGLFGGK